MKYGTVQLFPYAELFSFSVQCYVWSIHKALSYNPSSACSLQNVKCVLNVPDLKMCTLWIIFNAQFLCFARKDCNPSNKAVLSFSVKHKLKNLFLFS